MSTTQQHTMSECPICVQPLEDSSSTRTKCGHTFHESCLFHWTVRGNRTCPCCRGGIEVSKAHELFTDIVSASLVGPEAVRAALDRYNEHCAHANSKVERSHVHA